MVYTSPTDQDFLGTPRFKQLSMYNTFIHTWDKNNARPTVTLAWPPEDMSL